MNVLFSPFKPLTCSTWNTLGAKDVTSRRTAAILAVTFFQPFLIGAPGLAPSPTASCTTLL